MQEAWVEAKTSDLQEQDEGGPKSLWLEFHVLTHNCWPVKW